MESIASTPQARNELTIRLKSADWMLFVAEKSTGQKLSPFDQDGRLLQIHFEHSHLSLMGSCGRLLAPYRIDAKDLYVGEFLFSREKCNKHQAEIDLSVASLLNGKHRVTFDEDPRWRDLRLMQFTQPSHVRLTMYENFSLSSAEVPEIF